MRAVIGVALMAVSALGVMSPARAGDPGEDDDRAPEGEDLYRAVAGAEQVPVAAPTWCANAKREDMPNDAPMSFYDATSLRGQVKGLINLGTARRIAWSGCLTPKGNNRLKWLASWRQAMVNTSGMTVQENAELLKLLVMNGDKLEQHEKQLCDGLADDANTPPAARVTHAARRSLLGCKVDKVDEAEEAAWSMARSQAKFPNQIVTLVHVTTCLDAREEELGMDEPHLLNNNRVANFAMCSHDLKSLDKTAFLADLKAQKVDFVEQVWAIKAFDVLKLFAAQHVAAYAKVAKKYPAFDTVIYKAPEAGFTDWVKQATTWSAPLQAAADYEAKYHATSASKKELKKAFDGCGAPLRKGFEDYLRAKKPKTAAEARALGSDPVGVELLSALAACDAIEGRTFIARAESELLLGRSYALAGPRAAAYTAAAKALGEIEEDQSGFPVKTGLFNATVAAGPTRDWAKDAFDRVEPDGIGPAAGDWTDRDGVKTSGRPGEADGEIEKISKDKEKGWVILTFKTVSWKEQAYSCANTNHVDHLEWTGNSAQVVYQQHCKPAGMEALSSKMAALRLPEALAAGLKPGMFARVFSVNPDTWRGKGTRPGFVIEAYPDKGRKKLAYAAGVAL